MTAFYFNHIGSRLSTETPCGAGYTLRRGLYFNHIGSRLSTETVFRLSGAFAVLNFNHIGSRLSTETTKRSFTAASRRTSFQPHRLTVEH